MAQSRKACKDCGAPIGFIRGDNDRWIPVDPETDKRHVCDLVQTCRACGNEFKGSPWMDKCRECFRINRPNPERPPADTRPPRSREPLQRDLADDDDAPPF